MVKRADEIKRKYFIHPGPAVNPFPDKNNPPLIPDDKAVKKLAEEWAKAKAQLELDISKSGLTDFEQKLLDIRSGAEELRKQFGDKPLILKWETQKSVEILDQDYMRQEEEQIEQAKKVADAQTWLTDRINSLTLSEFEYKKEKLREEYEERAKYIGWTEELYNAFSQETKKLTDDEMQKKLIIDTSQEEKRLSLMRDQSAAMKEAFELTGQWNEARQEGLNTLELEGALIVKRLEDEKAMLVLQAERLDLTDEEYNRIMDIVGLYDEYIAAEKDLNAVRVSQAQLRAENPMSAAWQDTEREWKDTNQQLYDISRTTYQGVANAFSAIAVDSWKHDLKDFKDYFTNIWDSILKYFGDMVGQMVARYLAGLLGMKQAEQGANLGSSLTGAAGGGFGSLIKGAGLGALTGGFMGGTGSLLGGIGGGLLASTGFGGAAILGGMESVLGPAILGALGTSLNLIIPIIGAAIGAGIGKLIDDLINSGHSPNLQLGYGGTHNVEYQQKFGDTSWGLRQWDEIGKKNTDTIIKVMDTVREQMKGFMSDMGMDISKLDDLWKSSQADADSNLKNVIQRWVGEYASFLTGIDFKSFQKSGEEMADTIGRIIAAFYQMEGLQKSLDMLIGSLDGTMDMLDYWNLSLGEADENIRQLKDALGKATDPSDIVDLGNQLMQSIYSRYEAERDFILGLEEKINDLKNALADLALEETQRMIRLSGISGTDMSGVISSLTTNWFSQMDRYNTSSSPAEQIGILDTMVGLLESWIDAQQQMIADQYEPLIEANEEQIDILNEQLDAMQEWIRLNEQVKDYLKELTQSSANPADIMERTGMAQTEVERLRGLYEGATGEEKAGYGQQLLAAIQDYLGLAQEAYQRPSDEYQDIWGSMVGLLTQLESESAGYAESAEDIQGRIRDLTEENVNLNKQMQQDLDNLKPTIKEATEWLAREYTTAFNLRAGEITTEINSLETTLKAVIGDKTVGAYLADLQTATVTELQAIKTILETQWGLTGLPAPGEPAVNPGGGGGSGGEAGGGGDTGGGVEKFIGPFGGGSVYPPEYWGMTFTQGKEGRWIPVLQESLESLGFSKSALLSNLNADNRALVLNEYADLLGSVYKFLANQTAPFTVPSYQTGTPYVPETGLALVHKGEQVIPASQRKAEGNITIHISPQITINASGDASPKEIARETRREFAHFLRYDVGREIVKEIQRSTR
jgi:hypothetical protein